MKIQETEIVLKSIVMLVQLSSVFQNALQIPILRMNAVFQTARGQTHGLVLAVVHALLILLLTI